MLIIVVLAPGEVDEAVHVTSNRHAMIVGAARSAGNPLVTQLHVHALRLCVSLGSIVVNRRRHGILDGVVAERVLIVQTDVPTGLDTVVVGVAKSDQNCYKTDSG